MFFLVEHSFGFTCSQLVVIEKDRIMAAIAAAALCATRPEARQGSPNPRRGGRRDPPNDGSSRRASAAPIGWFAKAATSARTKPSNPSQGSSQKLSFARGPLLPGGLRHEPVDREHTLGRALFRGAQHPFRLRNAIGPATAYPKNHHSCRAVACRPGHRQNHKIVGRS